MVWSMQLQLDDHIFFSPSFIPEKKLAPSPDPSRNRNRSKARPFHSATDLYVRNCTERRKFLYTNDIYTYICMYIYTRALQKENFAPSAPHKVVEDCMCDVLVRDLSRKELSPPKMISVSGVHRSSVIRGPPIPPSCSRRFFLRSGFGTSGGRRFVGCHAVALSVAEVEIIYRKIDSLGLKSGSSAYVNVGY